LLDTAENGNSLARSTRSKIETKKNRGTRLFVKQQQPAATATAAPHALTHCLQVLDHRP